MVYSSSGNARGTFKGSVKVRDDNICSTTYIIKSDNLKSLKKVLNIQEDFVCDKPDV